LDEYDETGTLVKSIPRLFSDGAPEPDPPGIRLDQRTGVTEGEEEIFEEAISDLSLQPFAY
jgi:hypothetical protein